MPSPSAFAFHASLCYRVPPRVTVLKCHSEDPERAVKAQGSWAIAIFFLAGVWVTALWLVIIVVQPGHRVHADKPPEAHSEEDPYGLEAFRWQQENTRAKRFKKGCKKACHFMIQSAETLIGTGVFVVSFVALVVVGGVQLPLDKPPCAKEPSYSIDAFWTEPAERISVVWCEQGALATVLLGALSFCQFLLVFSMLFGKVVKFRAEKHAREAKKRLKLQKQKAMDTGAAIEDGPDYGAGFRVGKMIPKEPLPDAIFQDYDGRVFDL